MRIRVVHEVGHALSCFHVFMSCHSYHFFEAGPACAESPFPAARDIETQTQSDPYTHRDALIRDVEFGAGPLV